MILIIIIMLLMISTNTMSLTVFLEDPSQAITLDGDINHYHHAFDDFDL